MVTYVYESLPCPGKKPRRFEIQQSIKDAALTTHPETGEPIRRCVVLSSELFVREATIERPEPRHKEPDHHGHDHHHDHH